MVLKLISMVVEIMSRRLTAILTAASCAIAVPAWSSVLPAPQCPPVSCIHLETLTGQMFCDNMKVGWPYSRLPLNSLLPPAGLASSSVFWSEFAFPPQHSTFGPYVGFHIIFGQLMTTTGSATRVVRLDIPRPTFRSPDNIPSNYTPRLYPVYISIEQARSIAKSIEWVRTKVAPPIPSSNSHESSATIDIAEGVQLRLRIGASGNGIGGVELFVDGHVYNGDYHNLQIFPIVLMDVLSLACD